MENTLYDMLVEAMSNGATDETINTVIAAARKSVDERNRKVEIVEEDLRNAAAAVDKYCCAIGENSPTLDELREMLYNYHHRDDEKVLADEPASKPKGTAKVSTHTLTDKEAEKIIKSFIDDLSAINWRKFF